MEDQGYEVTDTLIYQDNKSAILLENHVKYSSTKRTKHIDIRYFYVNEKVKKKEVIIEHCSANEMVADFFTKPLNGPVFKMFRAIILNERVKKE